MINACNVAYIEAVLLDACPPSNILRILTRIHPRQVLVVSLHNEVPRTKQERTEMGDALGDSEPFPFVVSLCRTEHMRPTMQRGDRDPFNCPVPYTECSPRNASLRCFFEV
jgi:hypothetical protein